MNNKILVVDDESRIRKIIRDFLVREGYVVCEAEDGEAALDIFCSNNDIDLIIMDVMMPKMDGWQLCKEVRKLSKEPILNSKGLSWALTNIFPSLSARRY